MPLYDYRCASCGREVEVMHGIHDSGPAGCEACGGAMGKVLSPPAIHFKGSGWAKKDAAKAGPTKAKPEASPSTTGQDGSGGETTTSTASEPSGSDAGSVAAATSSASGKTD